MGVLDSFFAGFDRGTAIDQTARENKLRKKQLSLNERGIRVQERSQDRLAKSQELVDLGRQLQNSALRFNLRQSELEADREAEDRVKRAEFFSGFRSSIEDKLDSGVDHRQGFIESLIENFNNAPEDIQINSLRFLGDSRFSNQTSRGSFGAQGKPLSPMEEQRGVTMLSNVIEVSRNAVEPKDFSQADAELQALRRFSPETGYSEAGIQAAADIYAGKQGLKPRMDTLDAQIAELTQKRNQMSKAAETVIKGQFRGGNFQVDSAKSIDPVLNQVTAFTEQIEQAKAERAELQSKIDKAVLTEGFQSQFSQGLINEREYLEKLSQMRGRGLLSSTELEQLARSLINGNP